MGNESATMKPPLSQWLARILGLVVASVPILLASDAFSQGDRSIVVTLLVHAAMAVPLGVALLVAWFRPRIGALIYMILGVLYAIRLLTGAGSVGLIFALPFFVIGVLFWWGSRSLHEE